MRNSRSDKKKPAAYFNGQPVSCPNTPPGAGGTDDNWNLSLRIAIVGINGVTIICPQILQMSFTTPSTIGTNRTGNSMRTSTPSTVFSTRKMS